MVIFRKNKFIKKNKIFLKNVDDTLGIPKKLHSFCYVFLKSYQKIPH